MPKSTASSSSYSSDGVLPATSSTHPYGLQEPNEQDSNPFTPGDYTENATAGEIREAIEITGRGRGRSDSMSGWGGEEDGNQTAIFSGPGAQAVPSSVTSMHHFPGSLSRHSFSLENHRRRSNSRMSLSRRQSTESRRNSSVAPRSEEEGGSAKSTDAARETDEPEQEEQGVMGGVFDGIASALGFGSGRVDDEEEGGGGRGGGRRSFSSQRSRSRPNLSQRSSTRSQANSEAVSNEDLSEGDDWGYSSNEDGTTESDRYSISSSRRSFDSENNDLLPPSSRPHSPSSPNIMPLQLMDEVFQPLHHETQRSATEMPKEFASTEGSKSRQIITLPDEDLSILFVGYATVAWKEFVWWIGCLLSVGVLGLVGRWVPSAWVGWVGVETEFGEEKRNQWVLVETPYKDLNIQPIQTIPYPYPLSTVFPPTRSSTSTTPNGTITGNTTPTPAGPNGAKILVSTDLERGRVGWEDALGFLKVVEYRYTRFALDERSGDWRMIRDWRDHLWTSLKAVSSGLDESTREQRRILFGGNSIDIEGKSVLTILLDEVLHPFYVFQVASIVLWSLDDYYYYAFAIALISVSSILQTLFETKRTIERMREMSRFSCDVQTLIGGEWLIVDSSSLVPGDIFDAADTSLGVFPCDAVLLSGDAIVNESMLTGESVPVSKIPIKDEGLVEMSREVKNGSTDVDPDLAKHFLFAGTKIIRVRPVGNGNGSPGGQGARAPALVVRTGFNTTKGALVRSMLFPKPMGFKFYRDSMNFIGVLAMIAGLGFLVSVGKFIEIGIKWHTILVRALDLITVVVPPALPATLSIGTTFAIDRLRKLGIFCISPNRVNIGGKINVVCFDKTGTLTEEGLEVLGVRSIDKTTGRFSELHSDVTEVPLTGGENGKTPLLYALATCHSLKRIDEDSAVGDPLDIEMFNFTGWILEEGRAGSAKKEEPPVAAPVSPVVVKAPPKQVERPQTLVQTVVRPPSSAPFQVEDAIKAGSRVSSRPSSSSFPPSSSRSRSAAAASTSTRSSSSSSAYPLTTLSPPSPSSQLPFPSPSQHAHFLELGVIRTFDFVSSLRRMSVVVKRLKSPSMEVYVKGAPEVMADICDPASFPQDYEDLLSYYTKHGFRVIAIAGKSVPGLTWLKAQRMKREQAESGLQFLGLIIFENKLKPTTTAAIAVLRGARIAQRVVSGDNIRTCISVARECGLVSQSATVFLPKFAEGNVNSPDARISWHSVDDDDFQLDEYSLKPIAQDAPQIIDQDDDEPLEYSLAVTGDVFRWMVDFAPLDTFQRMLIKGVIFGRFSPDEKAELVERLQGLGYTVCFCGDGANDCGALKAADVGISLSEAEASVAAPFTSRIADISCVIEVIKEGRAALVTSFSCFKYMALYSLIQFTTITLLYSFASSLGDFQFLYIDLFIIIPIAVAMGRTLPSPEIHHKRPTGSLVSKRVLTSIITQTIINGIVQLSVFFLVKQQPWYEEPEVNVDKLETLNFENTALFLVSSFQYILMAAIFSVGPPYRKPLYSNFSLIACLTVLTGFSSYILLFPSIPVSLFLDLMDIDMGFKLQLLGIVVINALACVLSDKFAEGWIVKGWTKSRNWWRGRSSNRSRRRVTGGKLYKAVESRL